MTVKHAPIALIAMFLWSCATTKNDGESDWTELEVTAPGDKAFRVSGTVKFLDLEGGVFVIRDDAGVQYNPTNLPEPFRQDGLSIEADAFRRDGMVSIAMVGPMIELSRIRERPRPTGLTGTSWLLEDLAGLGVVDNSQATLAFLEDGQVSGSGSCNRFSGSVTIDGNDVSFGNLVSTRKACIESIMRQEDRYLEALEKANRFELDGSFLLLHVEGSSKPLKFIRVDRMRGM